MMCHLARQAISDARDLFLSTSVVTSQMPNLDLFHLNTNSTLENFKSLLSNNFIHNLRMFRGLVSVHTINWDPVPSPNLIAYQSVYMKSRSYGGCDCATMYTKL